MAISLVFAPDLVKASIDGRLPHGMGVARLTDLPFPRAERFGRRPARIVAGEPSRLEISTSELIAQWFSSSG